MTGVQSRTTGPVPVAGAPGAADLGHLLRAWSTRQPDQVAVIVTDAAGRPAEQATYREWDRRARAVAAALADIARPGERALLALPTGLDFAVALFGCFYAGVIAVPVAFDGAPKLSPAKAERLGRIAADAGPAVILGDRAAVGSGFAEAAGCPPLVVADVPDLDDRAAPWRPCRVGPDDTAFLQYTSGSTSAPKGVRITHRVALADIEDVRTAVGAEHLGPDRFRVVSWLPLYHDMGLFQLLTTLHAGGRLTLLPPAAFLRRPLSWLEAVSRERAFATCAPDFAYGLCAKFADAAPPELDLSSLRVAFNGAEPVRSGTMERFAAAFADHGFDAEAFTPCYGLAEAMCFVSGRREPGDVRRLDVDGERLDREGVAVEAFAGAAGARPVAGCGRPAAHLDLRIVDAGTGRVCGPRRVGEIWLAGTGVSPGYWRAPGGGADRFGARLAEPASSKAFLRTGDLGFLDERGQLFVLGRLDDMIVINGRNHHPPDIELTVGACHPDLSPDQVAAFGFTDPEAPHGAIRLGIAAEAPYLHSTADTDALIESAIRRAVIAEHGVWPTAVLIVEPSTLPRTTSGKLQRHRCPELL